MSEILDSGERLLFEDTLPTIVSHWNYDYTSTFSPPMEGASMTVPNQTLSVEELNDRYIRGLAIPGYPILETGDLDVAQFDNMDKFERVDAARRLKERVAKLYEEDARIKSVMADNERKLKMDKLVAEQVEARLKESELRAKAEK